MCNFTFVVKAELSELWKRVTKNQHNPGKLPLLTRTMFNYSRCSLNCKNALSSCSSWADQVRYHILLLAEPATGNQKISSVKKVRIKYKPTCLVVFFTLSVQSAHFLHKFPFFTASWVVDKIAREYFLQLPNTQTFNVFQTWNIGQRCPRSLSGQSRGLKHTNRMFLTVCVSSVHHIWHYVKLQQLG